MDTKRSLPWLPGYEECNNEVNTTIKPLYITILQMQEGCTNMKVIVVNSELEAGMEMQYLTDSIHKLHTL